MTADGGPVAVAFGPVDLRLPAQPEMSRVARLAASGLASLAGCTVDEIEDIKIAVSEVLIVLVEGGGGAPIDLRLAVESESFLIEASMTVDESVDFDVDLPDLELCHTVLTSVCLRHRIDVDGRAVLISAAVARVG